MDAPDYDAAARELAPWLVVTPVIAGDGAMRWTSPYTGTCCTIHYDGLYTITRRDAEGTVVAVTGRGPLDVVQAILDAPQSLPSREAAARAVVRVDLERGLYEDRGADSNDGQVAS